jgi:hypothetical protein
MSEKKDNIIELTTNSPLPRPLKPIECACGCGHSFPPRRKDQMYLNKQHADFGYNHGKRKTKNRNRIRTEKILLKNDNILARHYKAKWTETEVKCYLDILKADGFDPAYNIGTEEADGVKLYYSYNYCYQIYHSNNGTIIKITKL